MAETSKTIELIFNAVDKTGAATQAALSNVEKFSGSVQNLTAPIADFTVGALKLEAGLLTAGAALVAFSVKTASDFDSAFRQISTIVDASAEDLDRFKQAILTYASTSTQPLEQITNALGNAIGSGVDYAESLGLLATAEKLAVATRSDLDGTTKVLVSTLNSYGLSIDNAGKISDLFFKIIDEGDIGMNDLAASFAKVAPIAKISGVSLEEVGAAIATLTASGIKPAESIEYLRGAISNIISPTKQGSDLAEELGIQFNAAGLKANGLAGLLQQVAEKTGGSADKMKLLFGDIGGFTAAATLAGPQAAKFSETLQAMGNVAGATDEAFKKITGSLDVAGAKIATAFNALTVSIGQPLLDEFGGVAQAIAAIFNALGKSVQGGGLAEIVEYIESIFQDVQRTLETVAKNLPAALEKADLSGFIGGIDAVVGAFRRLFDNIDLSTVDGLSRAIELAGAAFLGLSKFSAGVIESFKPLFDLLVRVGTEAADINPDILQLAGNFSGFATQLNVLAGGLAGLMPWLETLVGLLVAKEGLSLLGGIRSVVAAAPALAAALGPLALGASALYAGDQIVRLTRALLDLKAANENLARAQEDTNKLLDVSDEVLADFALNTGFAVKSVDEAQALIAQGRVVWDDATERYVAAGSAMTKVAEAVKAAINPFEEQNQKLLQNAAASKEAAFANALLNYQQYNLLGANEKVVPIIDAATGAITGYEKQLIKSSSTTGDLKKTTDQTGDSLEKIARETKAAQEAQRRWNEEVAKMKHAEALKLIESQTAITTARIEADAQKMTAAFESVNTTINSTGELLGDLFGALKGSDNMSWDSLRKVDAQIEKENTARQNAFDLQKRLTEAQIREIEQRTKKMENGDALIKIDGAGLQPHLEAFMWEILRTIQVRVDNDGLELLVGT